MLAEYNKSTGMVGDFEALVNDMKSKITETLKQINQTLVDIKKAHADLEIKCLWKNPLNAPAYSGDSFICICVFSTHF